LFRNFVPEKEDISRRQHSGVNRFRRFLGKATQALSKHILDTRQSDSWLMSAKVSILTSALPVCLSWQRRIGPPNDNNNLSETPFTRGKTFKLKDTDLHVEMMIKVCIIIRVKLTFDQLNNLFS
jgi:hypothetical protein